MSDVSTSRQGKNGIELSSLDWLLLHHRVKLLDRQEIVRKLDIQSGDRVLDLGCGPGLWTQLLADAVGPAGCVVGVDFDPDLLAHARSISEKSHPGNEIRFLQMDMADIGDLDETYDVIFFSNCFCYIPEPSPVIAQMKRIIRPGGRIIGRNWDGGPFALYPLRERILTLVQHHLAIALEKQAEVAYFDHYFGRKMPGIFRRHGFSHVTCETHLIERFGPADAELGAYIQANGAWMADKVADTVDPVDLAEWRAYFDPEDPRCGYLSDDFYFCMTEMAVTGYV